MRQITAYVLVPLMSILLVSAQACWGSAIKNGRPFELSTAKMISYFLTSPNIWAGVFLYAVATIVYFRLLSLHKFFAVQIGLAALAIVFSTLLSVALFHEKLSLLNLLGMVLVLAGLTLVFSN